MTTVRSSEYAALAEVSNAYREKLHATEIQLDAARNRIIELENSAEFGDRKIAYLESSLNKMLVALKAVAAAPGFEPLPLDVCKIVDAAIAVAA